MNATKTVNNLIEKRFSIPLNANRPKINPTHFEIGMICINMLAAVGVTGNRHSNHVKSARQSKY